jgi:hypothetical protein
MRKGELYRLPATPPQPRRELDPDVLAAIRRVEEAQIRDYLKRRRAS